MGSFPLYEQTDLGDLKRRFTLASLQLGSLSLRAFTLAMCLFATTEVPSGLAQAVDSQGAKKTFTPNIDISLGVFGQLTSTRMPTTNTSDSLGTYTTQAAQGTSPSAGVLGTFHQSFKPWLGYNINLGYSRFSENYSLGQAFVPIKGGPITMPRSEFSRGSIGAPTFMKRQWHTWSEGRGQSDSVRSLRLAEGRFGFSQYKSPHPTVNRFV